MSETTANNKSAENIPWVSFCMTTYKRPEFLRKQLQTLAQQTFTDFQVIISDNDPEGSGEVVVREFNDPRVLYFRNEENLGMVKSFNRSLSRARSEFVVMITDDDPVYPDMLMELKKLYDINPELNIYAGFKRVNKNHGQIEMIKPINFPFEILNPSLTENILWSSCIMRRLVVLKNGGFPDYGSPHLADHLMIALCGATSGGLVINRMFSTLSHHDSNFSKTNLDLYYIGCKSFYEFLTAKLDKAYYIRGNQNAIINHLNVWFVIIIFNLLNFYTYKNYSAQKISEIQELSLKIKKLEFMKSVNYIYYKKYFQFKLKQFFKRTNLNPKS